MLRHSPDHPEIVKGLAGSPYAIRDYYSVNPDLADDVEQRNQEFDALIQRSHKAGLKVIIDIVPNHVARQYRGLNNPTGISDFGEQDDTTTSFAVNNNFYYILGKYFQAPVEHLSHQALSSRVFVEYPAKWTGSGTCSPNPNNSDWYETAKLNFGIDANGKKHFPTLPQELRDKDWKEHWDYWRDKTVPDTWIKFKDIALFWLGKGVDGFRFDMAEMVPVEFWSYLNSSIKQSNSTAITIAEIYQHHLYRDYIQLGLMDYLYDKVDLYDTLKRVMQDKCSVSEIGRIEWELRDIDKHLVRFLENHDEQRIAHQAFAGDADLAKPAMLVATCLSPSASLVYFGQEVGEAADLEAGYGKASRTSIFDYIGVSQHQKWVNNKQFDGGGLNDSEHALREFYSRLIRLSANTPALIGEYHDLYAENYLNLRDMQDYIFPFARSTNGQKLILLANFHATKAAQITLTLPKGLVEYWQLDKEKYLLDDLLSNCQFTLLNRAKTSVELLLPPLASLCLELTNHQG